MDIDKDLSIRNSTLLTRIGNGKATESAIAGSVDDNGEDLSVVGVMVFLIVWTFGVLIEIAKLIPLWIWCLIVALLYVRYLLRSTVQLVVGIVEKFLFFNLCATCDYVLRLTDVKRTRRLLTYHMKRMKVGVWISEEDSEDETAYRPLPQEEDLMRQVDYELANIVII